MFMRITICLKTIEASVYVSRMCFIKFATRAIESDRLELGARPSRKRNQHRDRPASCRLDPRDSANSRRALRGDNALPDCL